MKKLISILLVVVMLVAMVPAMAFTTSAATTPSGKWTDAGNYDLSWASGLITTTATGGQSVTVDGKIYTIKYISGTYEIDTVKKLAGIAVLANAGDIEAFSGATFKLTAAEYDLSAHLWDPIANTISKKFRGNLISDSGTVIKGMTVKSTDAGTNGAYGFIGVHGNGNVKNITLQDASIDVMNGYVGSFVGFVNYGGGIYENLKSDATIKCSTAYDSSTGRYASNTNAWNGVGGIIGRVDDWGGLNQQILSCVFTGSIDAPTASAVGGILAIDRRNASADGVLSKLTVKKCVVSSEFFNYGAERPGNFNAWYGGMGGIVGIRLYGDIVIEECYVSIGEFKVYAEQDTPENPHEGVGGILGNWGENSKGMTFKNCQVDMLSSSELTSNHHATFVGRQMSGCTFESCVNTGALARIKGAGWNGENTFAWSARNGGLTDGGNNFASFKQLYGYNYTEKKPTVIESVDTWKTSLDSTVWSERAGSIYPILKIAKDYAQYSVSGAGVDYSFFNIAGCKVTTQEELNAMAKISDMMGTFGNSNYLMAASGTNATRVVISPALATADMTGYSATFKNSVNAKLGVANKVDDGTIFDVENTDGNDDAVFAQVSLEKNENNLYDIRFVITVNDISACDGVKFDVAASRGDKFGAFIESDVVINAYKTVVEITADGEVEHTAEGDAYYVICVVNNVDLSAETTFTVRANAVTVEGKTTTLIAQSAAVNFVVPAAN